MKHNDNFLTVEEQSVVDYIAGKSYASFGEVQVFNDTSFRYTKDLLDNLIKLSFIHEEHHIYYFNGCSNHSMLSDSSHNSISDDHYKELPIQAIDVQEQINERNIAVPLRARLDIAYGTKYPIRAGLKEGEDWEKDIRKAINYYFRALTGKWIRDADISEYFKNVS